MEMLEAALALLCALGVGSLLWLLFGLLGFSAHSLLANIIVSVVGACVFLFVARRLTK